MSRLRVTVAVVVAAAGGAGLFAGQVALAGWIGFMRPYEVWTLHSSDESVYFHEFLATWFAVTGIVLAVLLARVVAGSPVPVGWHVALALAAGAGAGASVPWVTGFLRAADPAGASPYTGDIRANLVWLATAGTVLGTVTAGALLSPALRRGMTIWIAWTWLVFGYQVLLDEARYPRSFPPYSLAPLGVFRIPVSYHSQTAELAGLAVPLLPVAALAWWSARRRERWPAAGALTGPVLIVAAYLLGLQRLPATGDHYGLLEDLGPWVIIALAGTGIAALSAYLGGRRHRSAPLPGTGVAGLSADLGSRRSASSPPDEPRGVPHPVRPAAPPDEPRRVLHLVQPAATRPLTRALVALGGSALCIAALASTALPVLSSSAHVIAAAGASALVSAGLASRNLRPGRLLAAVVALAGAAAMIALTLVGGPYPWHPAMAPGLLVAAFGVGAAGALATGLRGAAWFGLLSGALHVATAGIVAGRSDPYGDVWQHGSFSIVATAVAMLVMTAALRRGPSADPDEAAEPTAPAQATPEA